MLTLKIKDIVTDTRSGVKEGRSWSITTQKNCFLQLGDEIRLFPVTLQTDQDPYKPGLYTFDGEALLTVGKFGLEVDRYRDLNLKFVKDL